MELDTIVVMNGGCPLSFSFFTALTTPGTSEVVLGGGHDPVRRGREVSVVLG